MSGLLVFQTFKPGNRRPWSPHLDPHQRDVTGSPEVRGWHALQDFAIPIKGRAILDDATHVPTTGTQGTYFAKAGVVPVITRLLRAVVLDIIVGDLHRPVSASCPSALVELIE